MNYILDIIGFYRTVFFIAKYKKITIYVLHFCLLNILSQYKYNNISIYKSFSK